MWDYFMTVVQIKVVLWIIGVAIILILAATIKR